jgi:hydroxymethylglutaryl-CoA reductase
MNQRSERARIAKTLQRGENALQLHAPLGGGILNGECNLLRSSAFGMATEPTPAMPSRIQKRKAEAEKSRFHKLNLDNHAIRLPDEFS